MTHHGHPQATHDPPAALRLTLLLLIPAVVLTAVGMLLLWPRDAPDVAAPVAGPARVSGEVLHVRSEPCPSPPDASPETEGTPGTDASGVVCGTVAVRLTSGADAGTEVDAEIPNGPGAIRAAKGDDVVLMVLQDGPDGGRTYSILDYQRAGSLWLVGAAFALAVIAFGRWRGLTALAGLGLTFAVLLFFIVPAILDGRSPILVAVVGAAAIMLTVLYLTHGFTVATSVAVAGTLASLTITAALSAIVTAAPRLSGIADESALSLYLTQGDVNMHGLLLAGIVIGSLGVLDDVTVTQSATVTELARANPAYGFRQLYQAGTRVGRAHIASVINTIVLAYAGASLPLLLLFANSNTGVGELLTSELVAQELVRSAVGTMGLVAAVPITTALAALIAARTSRRSEPAAAGADPPGRAPEPLDARPAAEQAPDPRPAAEPSPAPRPEEDRWAAFVERHPGGDAWGR